jgi:hypothetical protein
MKLEFKYLEINLNEREKKNNPRHRIVLTDHFKLFISPRYIFTIQKY